MNKDKPQKKIFNSNDKGNKLNASNNNNNNNNKNGKKGKSGFPLTWVYVGLMALLFVMIFSNNGETKSKLPYTKFQECMDSGYVDNIYVDKSDQELTFEIKKDDRLKVGESLPLDAKGRLVLVTNYSSVDKLDEFIKEVKEKGRFSGDVKYENGGSGFWDLFWQFFPFLFLIVFWILIMRRVGGGGGGVFSFGKSKAKLFDGGTSGKDKITFKDVAGLSGAKQEVQEVVDFLRNPQKYTELGGKIPKGILLVGPPGTGKTLLAKAVAGEANVSFFSLSGSDFVEMFVGVGASRVRDLFQQAKQKAPCIVFIDEIDAIGRARSGKASIQANDERESTLNQLLTEMDGFGANTGVIVMAATNRADILDKALLRAGRFDRQISVELPDLKERQQIFNVHLKPVKIDESVDVEMLARQTPGLSGADIANVCNEAALIAARRKQEWVDKQCFLDAVDRVLGGLEKKTKVMTENEKRTIAIHEAGHATISWFLQHANPLVKVTIVPRGNALGANWYMPEERPVTTKEELLDQICGLLGGRAAEELFTGHICTGASNDLERVTKMVYSMISIYGMGTRMPNVNYYNFNENSFSRPYSETTAQMMDEEVKDLIQEQYDRAKNVLLQHSQGLQRLAQLLIDKEVIYPADLETVFGPRQWRSRSDEIFELNQQMKDNDTVSEDDKQTDFSDENAEIIRQKALAAVIEKQRRLEEQNRQEEALRRQEEQRLQEEARRQQEETRRQQEEARRQQEEMQRQQQEESAIEIKNEVQEIQRGEEQLGQDESRRTEERVEAGHSLSLFPDIDDEPIVNEVEEKPTENDYNPFLDDWTTSDNKVDDNTDKSLETEVDNETVDKVSDETFESTSAFDVEDETETLPEDSPKVVEEHESTSEDTYGIVDETEPIDEETVDEEFDVEENSISSDEPTDVEEDAPEAIVDESEFEEGFELSDEVDDVVEKVNDVEDKVPNDDNVNVDDEDVDADDEEEEVILSSRKRRDLSIEEVIPESDDNELLIDLDDE